MRYCSEEVCFTFENDFSNKEKFRLSNIRELVCIVIAVNRAFAQCSNMQTLIDYFNSVFHNFYFNVITFSL